MQEEKKPDFIAENTDNVKEKKGMKRLFRNPDNKVLGGVCSGIAAYFGWDVTVLRILLIILSLPIISDDAFIVKGIFLFYVIAWIIIPEAKTATEKLSMKGMKVNIENIGKTVTDGFEKVNDHLQSVKTKSFLQKLGEGIVSIFGFLIKAALVIAAVCLTPALFILLVVCFSLLMVAMGIISELPTFFYQSMPIVDWSVINTSPHSTVLMAISGILVVGIPIVGFIHFLMSTFGGWKDMSFAVRMVLLIL